MDGKQLLLVDANSLAYRAFYALPPLTTSEGSPTGAVYGFLTMLLKLVEETQPEHIICAFDHPSPTFRHIEFKDYKGTRKPTPEDLKEQMPLLKQTLAELGLAFVELPGFEADDLIGTLACEYSAKGFDVSVLSGDRDCLQLVGDGRKVVLFIKGISKTKQYDPETVKQDMDVWPKQIPDYKALVGDPSDNIPGVKGVGAKTAAKLLNQYDDIEQIYLNIDEVSPPRTQKLLRDQKETAFFSKRLATIVCNAPCHVSVADARWEGLDIEKAKRWFNRLEFHSLIKRLDKYENTSTQDEMLITTSSVKDYEIINTEEKLETLARRIADEKQVSIYANSDEIVHYASSNLHWPKYIGISTGKRPCVIHFDDESTVTDDFYQDVMWNHLGPILENGDIKKLGFDLKWLFNLCFHKDTNFLGFEFDILVAAYLLDPTRSNYKLDDLMSDMLNKPISLADMDISQIHKINGAGKKALLSHLAEGAHFLFELADVLKQELKDNDLWDLAERVEFPLVKVLASMETLGIGVDLQKGTALRQQFELKLAKIEEEAYEIAGEKFNLSSPKQLSYILFEKLELTPIRKTKTGYSTAAEVLEILSEVHPLPNKILEYRHYSKLKSTYLDPLEKVVNPVTGRIHSTFHQTVTATGRLSSAEPNLQNIPVRTESGRAIRGIFIPRSAYLFMACDYSQIELRVMAHMSGDNTMIDAFKHNQDIHKTTASEIFGVSPQEVTPDLRSQAKAVNFGVIYGISEFGLARNTGVQINEARQFMESYFLKYPLVKQYMDKMIAQARKTSYVTTILGRRRFIPDINARHSVRRGFAERTAINTPIQGSAADLIKLAMVRIYKRITDENLSSRMILQVHDELIFEISPEEKDYMKQIIKQEMEGVMKLKVPLKVDIKVGDNWADV